MSTNINIRTDIPTKAKAEKLFQSLGINMTTAINMFLRKCIVTNGIPFDVNLETPNKETIEAFKEIEEMKKNPSKYKSYSSFEELLKDIDKD